jgi:hypothetical protein
MYSEVVRLQASDAFKTEQPLLAQDRDRYVNMVMNLWFP